MPPEQRRDRAGPPAGTAIAPHRWCGECDCLIGPFPHDRAAHLFTGAGPAGEAYETYRFQIVRTRDGVYLEVTRAREPASDPAAPAHTSTGTNAS